MNDKQRAKWRLTRARGMWRFVLLYGIVLCVAMLIATSIFDYFTSFYGIRFQDLYIKVPIYLVSGMVSGLVIWFLAEYQYNKSNDRSLRR